MSPWPAARAVADCRPKAEHSWPPGRQAARPTAGARPQAERHPRPEAEPSLRPPGRPVSGRGLAGDRPCIFGMPRTFSFFSCGLSTRIEPQAAAFRRGPRGSAPLIAPARRGSAHKQPRNVSRRNPVHVTPMRRGAIALALSAVSALALQGLALPAPRGRPGPRRHPPATSRVGAIEAATARTVAASLADPAWRAQVRAAALHGSQVDLGALAARAHAPSGVPRRGQRRRPGHRRRQGPGPVGGFAAAAAAGRRLHAQRPTASTVPLVAVADATRSRRRPRTAARARASPRTTARAASTVSAPARRRGRRSTSSTSTSPRR